MANYFESDFNSPRAQQFRLASTYARPGENFMFEGQPYAGPAYGEGQVGPPGSRPQPPPPSPEQIQAMQMQMQGNETGTMGLRRGPETYSSLGQNQIGPGQFNQTNQFQNMVGYAGGGILGGEPTAQPGGGRSAPEGPSWYEKNYPEENEKLMQARMQEEAAPTSPQGGLLGDQSGWEKDGKWTGLSKLLMQYGMNKSSNNDDW
jgi:hypothetical protein